MQVIQQKDKTNFIFFIVKKHRNHLLVSCVSVEKYFLSVFFCVICKIDSNFQSGVHKIYKKLSALRYNDYKNGRKNHA